MAFIARLAPASTNSDLVLAFRVRAKDTGDLIDLTGCTITIKFYDEKDDGRHWPRVTATTADAVMIPDIGVFMLSYLAASSTPFQSLRSGNYILAVTIARDGQTKEIVCGYLPVRGTH